MDKQVKYRLKWLVPLMGMTGVSAVLIDSGNPGWATVLIVTVVIVLINRHMCRCEKCDSWLTHKTEHRSFDNHRPGSVSITNGRECRECGHYAFKNQRWARIEHDINW